MRRRTDWWTLLWVLTWPAFVALAGCSSPDNLDALAFSERPTPISPPTATSTVEALIPTATASSTPLLPHTPSPTPTPTLTPTRGVNGPVIYGYSFEGRPLLYFQIGAGPIVRLLVGGIHGGYERNTISLVNQFLSHLSQAPELVPSQMTLYLIPNANPDGDAAGTDRVDGRTNGNQVDLNRNWDYQWQPMATHGTRPVKAGEAPFSEPETAALRDFILEKKVQTVVFYHSAMAEVYPGFGSGATKTHELAILFAEQTGYRYAPEGIPGQVTTGDAIDWLTEIGITAVEVELSTHDGLDWNRNLMALMAFLQWGLEE